MTRNAVATERDRPVVADPMTSTLGSRSRIPRLVALASSAAGLLFGLFLLTRGNRFDPTPWHHDDFGNLLGFFAVRLGPRPVSDFVVHASAALGLPFTYALLLLLYACNIGLCALLAIRWMNLTMDKTAVIAISACAGCAAGIYENATELTRYSGSITNLTSIFFGLVAVNLLLDYLEAGKSLQIAAGFIATFLSAFSKEDTLLFIAAVSLCASVKFIKTARKRVIYVMAALGIVGLLLGAYLVYRPSFVGMALRGTGGYAMAPSATAVVYNLWRYLTLTRSASLATAFYVIVGAGIFIQRRLIGEYLLGAMFTALLIAPYAALSETRIYSIYVTNWLPVLVGWTMAGIWVCLNAQSMRTLLAGAVSIAIVSVMALGSASSRTSIVSWLNYQQSRSRWILATLDANAAAIRRSKEVYVVGLDDGFSPFFFTGGEFVNRRLRSRATHWQLVANHGSFVAEAYERTKRPLQTGSVTLVTPLSLEGGSLNRRLVITFKGTQALISDQ